MFRNAYSKRRLAIFERKCPVRYPDLAVEFHIFIDKSNKYILKLSCKIIKTSRKVRQEATFSCPQICKYLKIIKVLNAILVLNSQGNPKALYTL